MEPLFTPAEEDLIDILWADCEVSMYEQNGGWAP